MTDPNSRDTSKSTSPQATKKMPLSCAECRRLKLKCNRVWPCSSCERRGLAELCPQGALATRPRHKPPPPTSQHVLQRIYELQSRINELESALAALQATVSSEPHPLLSKDSVPYLQKKLMRKVTLEKAHEGGFASSLSAERSSESTPAENDETEVVFEALGTLSIDPDGKSRFFGPTAVSEGLSTVKRSETSSTAKIFLPVDIAALAQAFPFSTLTDVVNQVHEQIRSYLPYIDRAEALCDSYFSYASFVAYPVPEDEVFEDIFCRLYGRRRSSRLSSMAPHHDDDALQFHWHHVPPDELAMFFGILALGTLTDLATEPFSAEAETYYQLSRALLTGQSVLTEPTLASVQTLFLGSYYEGLQSQENSSRDCWVMMALACTTGHIIGLHRDHSTFGLDEQGVQRRRLIFWEIYSMDLIESLAFGRPLSLTPSLMDTKIPNDTHSITSPGGEVEESFYSWKYRFCAEVLSVVSDHVLRVKTPNYARALESDRRLRSFTTTFGRSILHSSEVNPTTAAQLQMMIGTRETSMLYIHRVFFAHAVSTEPASPERSKYGRSVIAAFQSARQIIDGMQYFVNSHTEFAARLWFLWNHLLSASFILGSIVARAPGSSFAPHALTLLGNVCGILGRAAVYGGRAQYMLPIVTKLHAKGNNVRREYHVGSSTSPLQQTRISEENDDELAVIGGKTRVVVSSRPTSLSPQQQPHIQQPVFSDNETMSPLSVQSACSEGYHTHAVFPQTGEMFPIFPPSTDISLSGPSQLHEEHLHGVVDMSHPIQYLATDSSHAETYAKDAAQTAAQYAFSDDTSATPDVGSNEWQSLMHDLGF